MEGVGSQERLEECPHLHEGRGVPKGCLRKSDQRDRRKARRVFGYRALEGPFLEREGGHHARSCPTVKKARTQETQLD